MSVFTITIYFPFDLFCLSNTCSFIELTTQNSKPRPSILCFLSLQGLGTGWTVRISKPGEGEIFLTHPHRPRGPQASAFFPWAKAAGAWRSAPSPSTDKVNHLYSYNSNLLPVLPVASYVLKFTLTLKFTLRFSQAQYFQNWPYSLHKYNICD